MNRVLIILLLALGTASTLKAQEPDSLQRDSTQKTADSLAVGTADTTASETRRERRQRERKEQEAKEQEQVVFKDSARLALEALSNRPWKQSLMVPGWGQITNGGWWWIKVPVIYGGFVSAVLVFEFNNRYYHDILKEVQYRVNNNNAIPPNTKYPWLKADQSTTDYMIRAKDNYRRNRDLTVLVTLGWWGLQAVEAYVNSMLKNRWDIGDELGVTVFPTLLNNPASPLAYQPYAAGVKVSFSF
ncbi:hypothetical protein GCM10007415_14720 [Parapedobacter pyrenivorans]|uniref:DUF5683 domain-containing protein n=1 Tax=Parapedobacter pyrenivorans TaxID=1305674 RepID=A0A917HM39_9SPHI|nr:DUF5683 domain-containing protein [Parapedobacter pyrenivorans]GGG82825.1 hypothetical protein GCM10007415_14720 [Parapedobacter pyrenivorans]